MDPFDHQPVRFNVDDHAHLKGSDELVQVLSVQRGSVTGRVRYVVRIVEGPRGGFRISVLMNEDLEIAE